MSRDRSAASRPTLTDVAALAGVSLPTASKVVHGHAGVAAGTRRRVQAAMEELAYVPRSAVRHSVSVLTDQPATPYAMEVVLGITLAAEAHDVDVVLGRLPSAPGWARRLAVAGRSGAVVLTGQVGEQDQPRLATEHLPLVTVDPLDPGSSGVPSIGSTNFTGGMSATEHLLSLGHRHLGAIGGRRESVAARARMHGFHAACSTAGVRVDPSFVTFADFTYESGLEVAGAWLGRADRPTAVVAASDTQALGVLEAARRRGLEVPGDLSVIGYDDTFLAAWATPPLTTVRQPLQGMGAMALETLMTLVAGQGRPPGHVELATELVERGSTAPSRGSST